MVRETMAGILGFTSPDAVDVELPLRDIGIDSLTAALLRNRHAARTSRALAAIVAFDHQNLRALSQYLLSQLQESWKDASTTAQESDDATTATAASTSPGNAPVGNIPIVGTDSVALAQHQSTHRKRHLNLPSVVPLYRRREPQHRSREKHGPGQDVRRFCRHQRDGFAERQVRGSDSHDRGSRLCDNLGEKDTGVLHDYESRANECERRKAC